MKNVAKRDAVAFFSILDFSIALHREQPWPILLPASTNHPWVGKMKLAAHPATRLDVMRQIEQTRSNIPTVAQAANACAALSPPSIRQKSFLFSFELTGMPTLFKYLDRHVFKFRSLPTLANISNVLRGKQ